jgi:hypothetical protein
VLVDLSGKDPPGELKNHQPVKLEKGAVFTITTERIEGDAQRVSTNYPILRESLRPAHVYSLTTAQLPSQRKVQLRQTLFVGLLMVVSFPSVKESTCPASLYQSIL